MRIRELSLRNYRQFEEVDLELPARVIGIFGENGSGKSSLVESFAFALYGRARTKRQDVRTHGVLTDCEVRLVFEHGGGEYELRRSLRGKHHAADAELFAGTSQLATGVTDVDAEMQRLLHMDQQVFRASVFAEQKQLDAFSDVTAGKRKEMVLRLLGIRPVDEARSAARRESKATRQRADDLAGAATDLAELEAELKEARAAAKEAAAAAKAAGAELKAATATAKAAAAAFEASDAARERVEKIGVELQQLGERRKETEERRAGLQERLERLGEQLQEVPALEEELASLRGSGDLLSAARQLLEVRDRVGELAAARERLAAVAAAAAAPALPEAQSAADEAARAETAAATRATSDAAQLEALRGHVEHAGHADPSEPCPTCGRELGEGFAEYLKRLKRDVAEAKRRATASAKEAKAAASVATTARRALERARAAAEEARRAADRLAELEREAAALERKAAGLHEALGDAPPDVEALQARMARERELGERVAALAQQASHREQASAEVEAAAAAIAVLDERVGTLEQELARIDFDGAAHGELRTERDRTHAELDQAREEERTAADARGEAAHAADVLSGRLEEARATAAKVSDLRGDAHHLERVAMLLDGFRDHLVSRVGPELSREAEALFRELTNHEYDDLKLDEETLTIRIADGDAYFPIERFSGSETDLANLALRVAISIHLSRMSGADVGMMVLDEVLGSLDAERKDLLVQALGRLGARFHQLFVITHSDQVKDAFPAAIEVRKVGRRRSTAALV